MNGNKKAAFSDSLIELDSLSHDYDKFRPKDDNPTLGIILCSQCDETVVKYSLLNDHNQIFASRYQLVMPAQEELPRIVDAEIQHQKNENQLMEKYIQYRNNK